MNSQRWVEPSNATFVQLQSLVTYDNALYEYAGGRFDQHRAACRWTPRGEPATPSPRPLPNASCVRESFLVDWDVLGAAADLRNVHVDDDAACCAACVSDAQCRAWVSRGAACWLKTASAVLGPKGAGSGLVAGYVRTAQETVRE